VRVLTGIGAAIYVLFSISCFRLLWVDPGWGLAVGEGLFTLLGGGALTAALFVRRRRALLIAAGTLPLVGWFIATQYNSGPPFLVASLIAPVIAALAGAVELRRVAAA
jgi:hypothetical protein